MTPKESLLSPTATLLLFYNVDVTPDLALEGELLEMESEKKLQPVSHPYLSIFPPLFSGNKSDRHKDPSQDWVVYEEEPNMGCCDTGWSFFSDSISNNSPYKARSGVKSTL